MDKRTKKQKMKSKIVSEYSGKSLVNRKAILTSEAVAYLRSKGHLVTKKPMFAILFFFLLMLPLMSAWNFDSASAGTLKNITQFTTYQNVTNFTESDPYWSANYSFYYNKTEVDDLIDDVVVGSYEDGWINNTIDVKILNNNNSVVSWISSTFATISNLNLKVSWSDLWNQVYNKTEVNAINTSVNNYLVQNNNSVNNYIVENNVSLENYIIWVNSTNSGNSYEDSWINGTIYNKTYIDDIVSSLNFSYFNYSSDNLTSNPSSLNSNLLAYYSFDDSTANDRLGDYNGTITGCTNTTGKIGSALDFSGSSQYVTYSGFPHLLNKDTNFTISWWAYSDANANYYVISRSGEFEFRLSSSSPIFYSLSAGATSSALSTGTWTHFVGINNGTHDSIYKNGVLADVEVHTGSSTNSAYDFKLGVRASGLGGTQYYDGRIDELGIWNRALTQSEVTELYNSGSGVSYDTFSGVLYDYEFGGLQYVGDLFINGSVYAHDYITLSKVANVSESSSLSKLDNADKWLKKDGTIDYQEHYAVVPVGDSFGLSMETRVSEMEKMIYELKEENEDLRSDLEDLKKDLCDIQIFGWCLKQ